jgi:hypothetical protein
VRPAEEIRAELDALAERRSELWQRRGAGEPVRDEIAALTGHIDRLWAELRETSLRRRFGPRERILARARTHERFERELRRSLKRASALPER